MTTKPICDREKVLAHYIAQLQVAEALVGMGKLKQLLGEHRAGGPAPTYEQLASIAYGESKNEN